jgi:glycerol-3-phosphate dehydrogenase
MSNSDRMTLSFVLSAAEAGAQVANHLEVTGSLREGSRIKGVRAKDQLLGDELEIPSRVVLNAAGPWVDHVAGLLGGDNRPRLFHFSQAMNLVTRAVVGKMAVGVSCTRPRRGGGTLVDAGGRFLFIIPWRGYSMIGTSHLPYLGVPDRLEANEEDVCELLEDINDAYPGAQLERKDVRLIHRGLLPMIPHRDGSSDVTLVKKYKIQDYRKEGIEGLLAIVGVKYTTARDVAEKAVDRVFHLLGKAPPSSRSAETPLHGGAIERFGDFLEQELKKEQAGLTGDVTRHLIQTYGSAYREVLSHIESPKWAEPVFEGSPVIRAEVLHAVREEQALDLESVVLRRTELGSAGHPGRAVLETVAEIMSAELGWSEEKVRLEIESVEELYRCRS